MAASYIAISLFGLVMTGLASGVIPRGKRLRWTWRPRSKAGFAFLFGVFLVLLVKGMVLLAG